MHSREYTESDRETKIAMVLKTAISAISDAINGKRKDWILYKDKERSSPYGINELKNYLKISHFLENNDSVIDGLVSQGIVEISGTQKDTLAGRTNYIPRRQASRPLYCINIQKFLELYS